jgi:hypothetical protein
LKVQLKVIVKAGESEHKVPFEEICGAGGIVNANAYKALKLAATY